VRVEGADKNTMIGQYKQGKSNGYAVFKWADGGSYHGQWVDDKREGYGMQKWANKEEYHGQWKNHGRNGEGVFKEEASGKIDRAIWENDKRVKVLEIIKK
jgi:hypothetical protein